MKTYVCGHRNPDTDSVMSAYALAELRRRTGTADAEAFEDAINRERRWGEVTVKPGEFAIFFPPDGAHAPGHSSCGERTICKLVIKVKAE